MPSPLLPFYGRAQRGLVGTGCLPGSEIFGRHRRPLHDVPAARPERDGTGGDGRSDLGKRGIETPWRGSMATIAALVWVWVKRNGAVPKGVAPFFWPTSLGPLLPGYSGFLGSNTPRGRMVRPREEEEGIVVKNKRLYSIPEAAEYLGRSVPAVRELIFRGRLACVRIDRRVQVDKADLDQLIDDHKQDLAA